MNENAKRALRMLGEVTDGRFDPWILMGPHNAKTRVQILCALRGVPRLPKSAAGVTVLEREFFDAFEIPKGSFASMRDRFCEAARMVFAA